MNTPFLIQTSGPLFEAVQKAPLFPDGKTFVDSYPIDAPGTILADYEREKGRKSFDLERFVRDRFVLPGNEPLPVRPNNTMGMTEYIEAMWQPLTRTMRAASPYDTLISLPKPHIVPGGRFRECFYWDSYFTALGLFTSGRVSRVKEMAENFRSLIERFGFIPNGNRTYFATRSQPPCFAKLLSDLAESDEGYALDYTDVLEKEYLFWMDERKTIRIGPVGVNRYDDTENTPRPEAYLRESILAAQKAPAQFFRMIRTACASGWDFSTRWFADPLRFTSIRSLDVIPVDLNSLLYRVERTLMRFAEKRGESNRAKKYAEAATRRKEAIRTLFANERSGFFFDYDMSKKGPTDIWSLAGVFPLFEGIATPSQAERVAHVLRTRFLVEGGFRTTLHSSPHQWDSPNGWAPLQWATVKGLLRYGYEDLAKQGALRWLDMCHAVYRKTGAMSEKYNVRTCASDPVRGEYDLQKGFGWTNGVVSGFIDLFDLKRY